MIATRLLADRLPKRRQARHAGRPLYADLPHPDETMTEALESMAPVLRAAVPDGAWPPEDNAPVMPAGQPTFTQRLPRPTGPQPLLGTEARPVRRIRKTVTPVRPVSRVERDVLVRVRDGLEHMDDTHPYAVPPRTEADRIRQDAAGPLTRSQRGIRPLPPETPMAAEPVRIRRAIASYVRIERLGYPAPDGFSRHAREYADLMQRVSFATGTHSRYEHPAAWGATTVAIGGAR